MEKVPFWSVLKNNLKCAFCKHKDCRVRYTPDRKKYYYYSGTRFVDACKKDRDKKFARLFK